MELDRESERTALVAAFSRSPDEVNFRRLYRAFTPMLFGFAMRLAGSREDSEELVQETWSRAVARHRTFAGTARYGTWLTGILINVFRESQRHGMRFLEADADAETMDPGCAATREIGPASIDLERALRLLPLGYRLVVVLHDVNGCTHAEIGGLLGISDGTSKSQLARGRARLRELLGAGAPGAETAGGSDEQ